MLFTVKLGCRIYTLAEAVEELNLALRDSHVDLAVTEDDLAYSVSGKSMGADGYFVFTKTIKTDDPQRIRAALRGTGLDVTIVDNNI